MIACLILQPKLGTNYRLLDLLGYRAQNQSDKTVYLLQDGETAGRLTYKEFE